MHTLSSFSLNLGCLLKYNLFLFLFCFCFETGSQLLPKLTLASSPAPASCWLPVPSSEPGFLNMLFGLLLQAPAPEVSEGGRHGSKTTLKGSPAVSTLKQVTPLRFLQSEHVIVGQGGACGCPSNACCCGKHLGKAEGLL